MTLAKPIKENRSFFAAQMPRFVDHFINPVKHRDLNGYALADELSTPPRSSTNALPGESRSFLPGL
jgi:hypothetical protein